MDFSRSSPDQLPCVIGAALPSITSFCQNRSLEGADRRLASSPFYKRSKPSERALEGDRDATQTAPCNFQECPDRANSLTLCSYLRSGHVFVLFERLSLPAVLSLPLVHLSHARTSQHLAFASHVLYFSFRFP